MQLFGLSANPKNAASFLCDTHVVSQAKETMQILYTALFLWGVVPPGQVDCAELGKGVRDHYKPFGKGHPVVQWAAACRRHFEWTLQHAQALVDEYKHRSGKKHLCELFLDHVKKHLDTHGLPAAMPESVTPGEWLATLGAKKQAAWLPRVATSHPPKGCNFGVVAVDMPDGSKTPDNWVLSYKQYYTHKRTEVFKRKMVWSGEGELGAGKRSRQCESVGA